MASMRLTSFSIPGEWPTSRSRLTGSLQLGAQRRHIPPERSEGGEPLQLDAELVEIDRLRQIVEGPFLQHRDGVADCGVPGHHDGVGVGRSGTQPTKQGQAVDLGQSNVGQQEIERRRRSGGHGLRAVLRADDLVAFVEQRIGDQRAEVRLILDDQNLQHVRRMVGPRSPMSQGIS